TESVSPLQSNNQIWTIEASAIGTDIHYSISNWSRGGTLVPQNLRIIAVPTSQEQPIQLYKILHLPTLSLLAFDAFSDTVVLVSPAKYRSEDEESVLRRVYNMTDPKDP